MTLEEMYNILESKTYYEKEGSRKFSFADNSIHIDRKALIPFSIYREEETFYLAPDSAIADEKELRIELEKANGESVHFYGKISGTKLISLEVH
jgi:hypothetical protein